LARVENRKSNTKISQLVFNETLDEHLLVWIGYTDFEREGYFVDHEGMFPGYQKWGTNMHGAPLPDNSIRNGTGQHCVAINYKREGSWDDHWCSERFGFPHPKTDAVFYRWASPLRTNTINGPPKMVHQWHWSNVVLIL